MAVADMKGEEGEKGAIAIKIAIVAIITAINIATEITTPKSLSHHHQAYRLISCKIPEKRDIDILTKKRKPKMDVDNESDSVDAIRAIQPDSEAEQEEVGSGQVEDEEADGDKLKEVETDDKLEEGVEAAKEQASNFEEDVEACLEEESDDTDEEVEMFKMIDMYSVEDEDKDKVGEEEKETENKKLGPSIPYRYVCVLDE